jgi:hypothetical protein
MKLDDRQKLLMTYGFLEGLATQLDDELKTRIDNFTQMLKLKDLLGKHEEPNKTETAVILVKEKKDV